MKLQHIIIVAISMILYVGAKVYVDSTPSKQDDRALEVAKDAVMDIIQ